MGKIREGQVWGKIKDIVLDTMVFSCLWKHLEGSVDMDIRACSSGGRQNWGVFSVYVSFETLRLDRITKGVRLVRGEKNLFKGKGDGEGAAREVGGQPRSGGPGSPNKRESAGGGGSTRSDTTKSQGR